MRLKLRVSIVVPCPIQTKRARACNRPSMNKGHFTAVPLRYSPPYAASTPKIMAPDNGTCWTCGVRGISTIWKCLYLVLRAIPNAKKFHPSSKIRGVIWVTGFTSGASRTAKVSSFSVTNSAFSHKSTIGGAFGQCAAVPAGLPPQRKHGWMTELGTWRANSGPGMPLRACLSGSRWISRRPHTGDKDGPKTET